MLGEEIQAETIKELRQRMIDKTVRFFMFVSYRIHLLKASVGVCSTQARNYAQGHRRRNQARPMGMDTVEGKRRMLHYLPW